MCFSISDNSRKAGIGLTAQMLLKRNGVISSKQQLIFFIT
jgi:hypothetical protein